MVERVLVQEMRFVDQEDGQEAFLGELLDMGADGPEYISGRDSTWQAQSQA